MPYYGLTLVIPSYNRANLILETIQSALAQTQPFDEIIVVDDGSTDHTLSVLRPYCGRITVIVSENVGVQAARNKGVDAAGSPYVTLCDSDDLLRPDYVATVGAWLARHPECDTLYANFQTFTDQHVDTEKFGKAPAGYFDGAERDGDFLSGIPDLYGKTVTFQPLFSSGVTTKKAFYQSLGGFYPAFNGIGSEDWEYTLRAIEHGNTAVCTRPMTLVRRHANNDSKNTLRQVMGEVTILEHALDHHPMAQRYRSQILADIDRRRIDIFELAFGAGQHGVAAAVLPLIRIKPTSIKFRVKQAITLVRRAVSRSLPAYRGGPLSPSTSSANHRNPA